MPQDPLLQTLLSKATSIGPPQYPKVTQAGVPPFMTPELPQTPQEVMPTLDKMHLLDKLMKLTGPDYMQYLHLFTGK